MSTPTPRSPSDYLWYFPRPKSPPANNVYAREGLFIAIDDEAISKAISGRFRYLDLNGSVRRDSYDAAKAREYIAAAKREGFNTEITLSFYGQDPVAAQIAYLMQRYWKEIGVGTVLISEPQSNYSSYRGDVIVRPGYPR